MIRCLIAYAGLDLRCRNFAFLSALALLGWSASGAANANCQDHNILVSNEQELNDELVKTCSGSVIRLKAGIWKDAKIVINNSGSPTHPITLKADMPGKTYLEGHSYINVLGDDIVVEGFYFRNGYSGHEDGSAIMLHGTRNHLTQTTIDNLKNSTLEDDALWVSLEGQYNQLSYNRFMNKTVAGNMVAIEREDNSVQYHHIHHNHFLNFASGKKQNGWEVIRVGDSVYSRSYSLSTIENNRFENCDGEIELVSIKSGKNRFRGNTIVNSQGLVTIRHGTDNIIENNIFLQDGKEHGGGIRLYDSGHIVRNNYIAGVRTHSNSRGGIVFNSGVNPPEKSAKSLNKQWTTYKVLVEKNTIFDSEQSYLFNAKKKYAASDIRFEDNIIVPALFRPAWRLDMAPVNTVFSGEIYMTKYLSKGNVGEFPKPGGINLDQMELTKNIDGLWLHASLGAQNLDLISASEAGPTLY